MNSKLFNALHFLKNGTFMFIVFLVAGSYVNDYVMQNDQRYVVFWGFVTIVSGSFACYQLIVSGKKKRLVKQLRLLEKTLDSYDLGASKEKIKKMLVAFNYLVHRQHSFRWMLPGLLIAGSFLLALAILTFYLSIAGKALELTTPFCLLVLAALLIVGVLIATFLAKDPELKKVSDKVAAVQKLMDQETNNALSEGVSAINTLLRQGQKN